MRTFKLLILISLIAFSLSAQVGKELYRPGFHYTPSYNWMNDPNGLVYYNGKYHLFYQYNPYGLQLANFSWGHAVSTDLVNWEEKPVAIPSQNGIMIYSGSVVVDWNNTSGFGLNGKPPLVAIYTGKSSIEDQRIAYSNDEGLTWKNYTGNPVLTMNNNQFRDPKVIWHKESQKWIMAIAQGSYQGLRLYSSQNLKNWTLLQGFPAVGNTTGFWECPDLFPLAVDNDSNNRKWVLVHSVSPTGQYFTGDFTGTEFIWAKEAPQGTLLDGFENEVYTNWTVTGNCFGLISAPGTPSVSGYQGNRLIKSTANGDAGIGKMISSDFTIQKKYISFLIGGGHYPDGAYIKLVVNGETMRKSTGMNEDIMKWKNWDVSSLIGKTAHLEIIDSVTGILGHINIDHIIQSNSLSDFINTGQTDYGKDFYAAQSFSDVPNDRRIWLAWMSNWNYAINTPTTPWKGALTIPREVKLETHNGTLRLVQKPIEELTALRKSNLSFNHKKISEINNEVNNNMINNIQNNSTFKQFELKAKIAVRNKSGFTFKFKKGGGQYTEFVFDFRNQEIRFDRSRSGALTGDQTYRQLQVAPLIIEDGYFDLHLFVDNCSAELFSAGGQVVMSNLIFPDSTSNKIEFTALAEDFEIDELNIWKFQKNNLLPGPPIEKFPLFKVYPNPVVNSNGITIKIKEEMIGEVMFRLFDATGKIVSEFQPTSNSMILPINRLGSGRGLYLLKGSKGSYTQTEKLVVLAH